MIVGGRNHHILETAQLGANILNVWQEEPDQVHRDECDFVRPIREHNGSRHERIVNFRGNPIVPETSHQHRLFAQCWCDVHMTEPDTEHRLRSQRVDASDGKYEQTEREFHSSGSR